MASQAARKSGSGSGRTKSDSVTSSSSRGYSSSSPSGNTSPVCGSTSFWTKVSLHMRMNMPWRASGSPRLTETQHTAGVSNLTTSALTVVSICAPAASERSISTATSSSCSSSIVFRIVNWKRMCAGKVCLTHDTQYSASDSVSSTGLEDAKSWPRLANSGMPLMRSPYMLPSFFFCPPPADAPLAMMSPPFCCFCFSDGGMCTGVRTALAKLKGVLKSAASLYSPSIFSTPSRVMGFTSVMSFFISGSLSDWRRAP
mmetsp:Transcript_40031/g.61508  ORF Transcript_40031/g.61508 Transcript_40031/m.61508 type:complete len:257 (-) Transcript_40031:240-1010(-)